VKSNFIYIFFILLILGSCSRKKDKFLNKKFHSTTTKYNYLFNGNNLFTQGIDRANSELRENFWELIPIEKFDIKKINQKENEQSIFADAEEKATLAIQKHSMNIMGEERNPIMDEAYLLLGKSRYYDGRYIPSLEAFNYILFKYPKSELVNEVKIWKEKINIKLNQNEFAQSNLIDLLEQNSMTDENKYDIYSLLAQAAINMQELDDAVAYLKESLKIGFKPEKIYRNKFLLSQLYERKQIKDTAFKLYLEVIDFKRKIPREFYIQSYLNKSNVADSLNLSVMELINLANDYENNKFLDIINFQLAKLHLKEYKAKEQKEYELKSIIFFNKSLEANSSDNYLISRNYLNLAEINFNNKNYFEAGLYYDSTLTKLDQKTKELRTIKRRRESLNDLIFYEGAKHQSDSLVALLSMNYEEQYKFFENYLTKLDSEKQQIVNQDFGSENSFDFKPIKETTVFYFYNPNTVAYGKTNFSNYWGNRKLKDNWRWSIEEEEKSVKEKILESSITKGSIEDRVKAILETIPKELKQIDSIKKSREEVYYKLGSIYKDQFEEPELSNVIFYDLLTFNSDKKLTPPTKFFIYKNLVKLDSLNAAENLKNQIIQNYPESKYAAILLDPDYNLNKLLNSYDEYQKAYDIYLDQKFEESLVICERLVKELDGDVLLPKIELLRAQCIAKIYGYDQYQKALEDIKLNHSATKEGKNAEIIINDILPLVEDKSFIKIDKGNNFKLVFEFLDTADEIIQEKILKINQYVKGIQVLDLKVSKDYYNNITTFVVIHGITSYEGGVGLSENIAELFDDIIEPSFISSSTNYKTIQIHKNLDEYKLKNSL
tara:strand:+ start:23911 stop:26403 length:2493 start_codon:yes stop_codon:yes gene_type:complete